MTSTLPGDGVASGDEDDNGVADDEGRLPHRVPEPAPPRTLHLHRLRLRRRHPLKGLIEGWGRCLGGRVVSTID